MKRITPLHEQTTAPRGIRPRLKRAIAHPFGVPVLVFLGLALISTLGSLYLLFYRQGQPKLATSQNFIVIINHDGERQTVPTDEKTVGAFLQRMNIKVAANDRVEPAQDQPITGDNFLINIYRSYPISIIDGDTAKLVNSAATTPRSATTQAGITVYPEDVATTTLTDNFVTEGTLGARTMLVRATPITLQLYGKPVTVRTQAKTVEALLKEKNITPTTEDTVKPGGQTAISQNMTVAVIRNGVQTITVDEDIAAPVQTILDTTLSFGSQAVRQEGSAGKKTTTYEITNQDGVEVSRKLLQSVTVLAPVTRIVAKGSTTNIPADKQAVMAAAGIAPSDYAYVDYVFSRESHWNAAAVNSGGCTGLGQACPGSKLAAACPNWQSDPVCQTTFFTKYASRYGGWAGAYNAWINKGWW